MDIPAHRFISAVMNRRKEEEGMTVYEELQQYIAELEKESEARRIALLNTVNALEIAIRAGADGKPMTSNELDQVIELTRNANATIRKAKGETDV